MQSLGLRSEQPLAFWLWLLHLCLSGERTLNSSWLALLWNLLAHKSLFCEHARGHCVVIVSFMGKVFLFFFFFLVSLVIAWFGVAISHLLPQFILRAIRPHPYPKDG